MDIDLYTLYTRLPETRRDRHLTQWSIDKDPHGSFLRGIVVKDSEPDFDPTAKTRFTSTSLIKHRNGMVITTRSGSTYTLLTPAPGFSALDLCGIPEGPMAPNCEDA